MTKKNTKTIQKYNLKAILIAGVVLLVLVGTGAFVAGSHKNKSDTVPTQNTPGYITADEARNQVDNFYRQYLHPKKETPEESREIYIKAWGSKNLVFYSKYYQHGFDPIVCSSTMPTSVTATSVEPGAGAVVDAEAKYPDGSTANIELTLVLNTEGFKIDSVACPGEKGNLPPVAQ